MNPWTVLSVARVIDGDSLILTRTRHVGTADGLRIDATDTNPVRVRLVHIDTPERGETGWGQAKADLETWVAAHERGPLTLHDAGRDNFGRILGDLHGMDGCTASLWMAASKGWPTWMETR